MGWSQAASADPAAVRRWRHPMTRLRMRGCVEDVAESEAASCLLDLVLEMLNHCCSHILSALQFQLQSSIGWILESWSNDSCNNNAEVTLEHGFGLKNLFELVAKQLEYW